MKQHFTESRPTAYNRLNQLYYLTKEIELVKRRLLEIDNIPYANEYYKRELYEIINNRLQKSIKERELLENYIISIKDGILQQAFILRFCAALSWSAVALQMGVGYTEDNVRMMCLRYTKKHPIPCL